MQKTKLLFTIFVFLYSCSLPYAIRAQGIPPTPSIGCAPHFFCFDYANLNAPIAGVAGGNSVVFVGEPLNGSVVALSRFTGQQIGQLPPPVVRQNSSRP